MKVQMRKTWLLWVLCLLGCEKVITLDLPEHKPQLVVNAMFGPDSVWQAHVTASQDINTPTAAQPVTDATVVIWENGLPIDTLLHDSADLYRSLRGRKPLPDRTYTLRASAPGYAAVQGSDHAPRVVIPTAFAFRDSATLSPEGQWEGEFSFRFQDWAGEHNYYVLDLYTIIHFYWDNRNITQVNPVYFSSPDPLWDIKSQQGQGFLDDATFDGQMQTVRVHFMGHQSGQDTVYARLTVLSETSYRYLQTMAKYEEADADPFAEPVRIYSNMTAGMGIFAGRSWYDWMVP